MAMYSRTPLGSENIPIINLLDRGANVSKGIVKACDEFGFFKKKVLVSLVNQYLQNNKLA